MNATALRLKVSQAPPTRRFGIQAALEWAFGREKAQLDLDVIDPEADRGAAVSPEWVIYQRGLLGCHVDCSGGGAWGASQPAHDAEVIAAFVAALPREQGGKRMATEIAACASAGTVPDYMPNARPRIIPRETLRNQYGWRAATEDAARLGAEGWQPIRRRNRRGGEIVEPVLYCPVIITPSPAAIAAARGHYLDWWSTLLHLSGEIRRSGLLDAVILTNEMPPLTPWRED